MATSTPLDNEAYVSLETFKKDGSGVKTPVWVAPQGGKLVVGTGGSTFKVKRLRNNPRVRLAACDARGKKIRGPWHEGTARVLPSSEAPRAEAALNQRYGWQRRSFRFVARLIGRMKDPVIIEITVGSKAP